MTWQDDVTNYDRAGWAQEALEAFAKATGMIESGDWEYNPEIVLADLLADLRHWCEESGLDFDKYADGSREVYEEEKYEEGPDDDEEITAY